MERLWVYTQNGPYIDPVLLGNVRVVAGIASWDDTIDLPVTEAIESKHLDIGAGDLFIDELMDHFRHAPYLWAEREEL